MGKLNIGMSGEDILLTASSQSIAACSRQVALALAMMDARAVVRIHQPFDFPSLRRQDADSASLGDNEASDKSSCHPTLENTASTTCFNPSSVSFESQHRTGNSIFEESRINMVFFNTRMERTALSTPKLESWQGLKIIVVEWTTVIF